ncbi:aryl-hydrocarbon-interacting protein-like 1 isoform X2 [Schistocerca americana]|uniref:aryl-hydrocarbon-interacting protein-like 1 isoform X2 n=1 Tax=Schistocerca americana TaxID=7009 RepID=UPI001F4F61D2|nr:aryl-hydrocarbon-interacting protein-like 1 isoform X2 [Schistocerca americana]XP_049951872.1 aryl-hydrocarbon-interacting protein-like 1 isoform X2 [Schistocerca serialis cubense]
MSEALISKTILHAGSKCVTFEKGTKVVFHFQTRRAGDESQVLDDSRSMGKPMELVLGKGFKLEVWETAVKMMAIHEVAKFKVDKSLLPAYPFVSKTLRESLKPHKERSHHCCAVTLQNEGTGYEDLNQLIKEPCDLEFIIELLKVEGPEEYKKESWQMNADEKLSAVPKLRERGNQLYKEKNFDEAAGLYAEALGLLEQLMLNEKPGDEEWNELNKMKIPLLLNYSQCKLYKREYYQVIEHCSTVLKDDPAPVRFHAEEKVVTQVIVHCRTCRRVSRNNKERFDFWRQRELEAVKCIDG